MPPGTKQAQSSAIENRNRVAVVTSKGVLSASVMKPPGGLSVVEDGSRELEPTSSDDLSPGAFAASLISICSELCVDMLKTRADHKVV